MSITSNVALYDDITTCTIEAVKGILKDGGRISDEIIKRVVISNNFIMLKIFVEYGAKIDAETLGYAIENNYLR